MASFTLNTCLLLAAAALALAATCDTCTPSGTSNTNCDFSCQCSTTTSLNFTRSYKCTAVQGKAGILFAKYFFPAGSVNGDLMANGESNLFNYTNQSQPFIGAYALPSVINTEANFSFHYNATNNATQSVYFITDAFPCVPTIRSEAAKYQITWTVSAIADPKLSASVIDVDTKAQAKGTMVGNVWTADRSCGAVGKFHVLTSANLTGFPVACTDSSADATFPLSSAPSAVPTITVNSATVNNDSTLLTLNVSWAAPVDNGGCSGAQLTFNLSVSSDSLGVIYATTLLGNVSQVLQTTFNFNNDTKFSNDASYTITMIPSSAGGVGPTVSGATYSNLVHISI